jgi:AcrR family transcriptional regulator
MTETAPERLPGGRHSIPPDLVVSYQRGRLVEASAAVLAERGYARATTTEIAKRAGVSTATLYKHYSDLWECLLAAYASVAAHLLEGLRGDEAEGPGGGLAWGLDFLAAEPAFAYLLCVEPPAAALRTARRELVEELAALLRGDARAESEARQTGREERLVAAALSLIAARVTAGQAETLPELEPQLRELLAPISPSA